MQLASLALCLSLTTLTLPLKAAACNLLQHLAHFLRNPLQEPAVQEEKEKNNYWRPLVKPKGVFSLKCLSPKPLNLFYSQLRENTRKIWDVSRMKDQSLNCFLTLRPPYDQHCTILNCTVFPTNACWNWKKNNLELMTQLKWEMP